MAAGAGVAAADAAAVAVGAGVEAGVAAGCPAASSPPEPQLATSTAASTAAAPHARLPMRWRMAEPPADPARPAPGRYARARVIRTVAATRYVTPLREGGSMPGLVEADDDGLYVLKFRGAGQGPKALVAELVAGELARAIGLSVPEIVFVELDPQLGRAEPDREIQELIDASRGPQRRARLPARRADLHARRPVPTRRPSSPPRSSGSTRWPPTSTARRRTPTCSPGTGGCG